MIWFRRGRRHLGQAWYFGCGVTWRGRHLCPHCRGPLNY